MVNEAEQELGPGPSGPFSPPASTAWRRQRLLRLGSSNTTATVAGLPVGHSDDDSVAPLRPHRSSASLRPNKSSSSLPADETAPLRGGQGNSYGTLPHPRARSKPPKGAKSDFRSRHGLPSLPSLDVPRGYLSNPTSPRIHSPVLTRDRSYFNIIKAQRPISAYDAPLVSGAKVDDDAEVDAKTNGVRVWYASYSSIDWLHDAIKDSVRHSRLRRRKSIRSRIRLIIDKSMGWIIVTIVGFLTAVVAYLVVRTEQWMFHAKEGYCGTGWWKRMNYCCPVEEINGQLISGGSESEPCDDWKSWGEVLGPGDGTGFESEIIKYVMYGAIAILLAVVSGLLTIHLTASSSFLTRKESGVLAPGFNDNNKDEESTVASEPKRKISYYAAGSGIPEIKTILSGFVIHGYLGGRVLFTKSLGLALSVASGLSLGKEGPFVHIASCIGNIISRYVGKYENNEAKRREILSAACAAGVAVAFGAPIGGTLFSLEEVSYFFPPKVMWRSFFCAMIAAITLRFLNPFGTGKLVLFQVTYDKDWHAYELIFFLLLGVFGGVYGAYFSKLNYRWSRHVRNKTWMKNHPIAEIVLITVATTALCFVNTYTSIGGTELVYKLFAECRTGSGNTHSGLCVLDPGSVAAIWPVVRAILVAMVIKAALTVVTFGIKVPAGIFIPTLGVGACAGRIMGIGMQWLQYRYPDNRVFEVCGGDMDCVIPGLYAMVGAAAALSGVTRTTVSLAVIMFELTDTLTYAVPVMLAVLVAKTVADALEPKGIYDLVIELSHLPYLDVKTEYLWGTLQINDATDRDVEVIRLDRENTVESLRDQLQALLNDGHDDTGFPILRRDRDDEGMRMVGYIGANELEHALSIVADEATNRVSFHTTYSHGDNMASSVSSLIDSTPRLGTDPFDFSVYMDKAPLTVQSNSPLELVHQFFVKLGARYVVVTDTDGLYEGVIDKKTWLAFLSELEEKS